MTKDNRPSGGAGCGRGMHAHTQPAAPRGGVAVTVYILLLFFSCSNTCLCGVSLHCSIGAAQAPGCPVALSLPLKDLAATQTEALYGVWTTLYIDCWLAARGEAVLALHKVFFTPTSSTPTPVFGALLVYEWPASRHVLGLLCCLAANKGLLQTAPNACTHDCAFALAPQLVS